MQTKKLIYEYIKKQAGGSEEGGGDGVDLQNQGRYYLAKIIEHRRAVLKRLLADK